MNARKTERHGSWRRTSLATIGWPTSGTFDSIDRLIESGPALGRPYADTVRQSAFSNMKELRTQAKGDPLRTFFAFDPRRSAILLIGGDKTGDDHFYERMVPQADRLYATYLEELKSEGLI